jgi:AcrR family transcriptional regulator
MGFEASETDMFLNLNPEKQQRILDAAIHEFADKGYARASMNVVVGKAGISKGALFKYFRSKGGLFAFVYKMTLNRVKDYLREVRDDSQDEVFFERLQRVMRAGVDFIQKHPGLARIHYHIIFTGDSPYKKEILAELHAESLRFLRALVEQGMARGELRSDLNPDSVAFVLGSVLDRFLQAHHLQFLAQPQSLYHASAEHSDQWIQEIVSLLKTGMENPGVLPKKNRHP